MWNINNSSLQSYCKLNAREFGTRLSEATKSIFHIASGKLSRGLNYGDYSCKYTSRAKSPNEKLD
jgi:hypothetical protein